MATAPTTTNAKIIDNFGFVHSQQQETHVSVPRGMWNNHGEKAPIQIMMSEPDDDNELKEPEAHFLEEFPVQVAPKEKAHGGTKMILRDTQGEPCGLIVWSNNEEPMNPSYTIFGRTPFLPEQSPSEKHKLYNLYELYEWGKVTGGTMSLLSRIMSAGSKEYKLKLVNGVVYLVKRNGRVKREHAFGTTDGYQFTVTAVSNSAVEKNNDSQEGEGEEKNGSQEEKEEEENNNEEEDEEEENEKQEEEEPQNEQFGAKLKQTKDSWEVTLGQGVDPSLMVLLTLILDAFLEKADVTVNGKRKLPFKV